MFGCFKLRGRVASSYRSRGSSLGQIMRWSASQNEDWFLRTKKENVREHKRVLELSQDAATLTNHSEKWVWLDYRCWWRWRKYFHQSEDRSDVSGGQFWSEKWIAYLPYYFLKYLFLQHFSILTGGKTELRVTLLVQVKCQRQCIGPLTFSKELKNVIIFFYIWKFTLALFYFDLYGLLLR